MGAFLVFGVRGAPARSHRRRALRGLRRFSCAPKAWAAVWALACWIAVVQLLADPLDLPEWGRKLSPLYLVGRVPMESPSWAATGCVGAAALALTLANVRARPRDLAAG